MSNAYSSAWSDAYDSDADSYTGSGTLTLTGTSQFYIGSGSLTLGGTAFPDEDSTKYTGSGTIALSGSMVVDYATYDPLGDGCQYHNGYQYRQLITIPRGTVASDLTGFVVLVELTMPSGHVATGADFTFEDLNHNTLNWDLESYSSGSLIAWVQVNLYADQDKHFYCYYGNPTVTHYSGSSPWGSFTSVYHLQIQGNGTANEFVDVASGNDGTGGGGSTAQCPTQVAGNIGFGQQFSNDYISTIEDDLTTTSPLTVSAWVNISSTASLRAVYSRGQSYPVAGYGWQFILGHDGLRRGWVSIQTTLGTYSLFGVTQLPLNTWHYLSAQWIPGSGIQIYVDGELDNSLVVTDSTLLGVAYGNQFGRRDTSFNFFGIIDELHVIGSNLSETWIATEFANQSSPSTFYTVGIEQPAIGLDNSAPASVVYPAYDAAGTITLDGSAPLLNPTYSYSPSGSVDLGSSAPVSLAQKATGSGSLVFGGTGAGTLDFIPSVGGPITLAGSAADATPTYSYVPAGGLVLSGSAARVEDIIGPISGGLSLGSSAAVTITTAYTAAGGLVLGNSHTGEDAIPSYTATGSGEIELYGDGLGYVLPVITGDGGLSLAGSADSVPAYEYTTEGGPILGSSAAVVARYLGPTPGGGLELGDSAPVWIDWDAIGSGGLAISGAAILSTYFYDGSGIVALADQAGVATAYDYTGSGILFLSSPLPPVLKGKITSGPRFTAELITA